LTPRTADLVAGLLKRQLHLPLLVLAGTAAHRLRQECSLDSERLQALDHRCQRALQFPQMWALNFP
jgi:hypothetical protein